MIRVWKIGLAISVLWIGAGPAVAAKRKVAEPPPLYLGVFAGSDSVADIPGICEDLGQRGFNAVWVTGFDQGVADSALMPVWRDAAGRHGLKVLLEGTDSLPNISKGLRVFMHANDWSDSASTFENEEAATRGFLDLAARHADMARATGAPLWINAQAFASARYRKIDGKLQNRPNARMPTPAEMRFQVWGSILSGARAVFFFSYQGTKEPSPENPEALAEWEAVVGLRTPEGEPTEMYEGLTDLARQLKPLYPLLGRLNPDGKVVWITETLLGRKFSDPKEGLEYLVFLNRDVLGPARLDNGTVTDFGKMTFDLDLDAGAGAVAKLERVRTANVLDDQMERARSTEFNINYTYTVEPFFP